MQSDYACSARFHLLLPAFMHFTCFCHLHTLLHFSALIYQIVPAFARFHQLLPTLAPLLMLLYFPVLKLKCKYKCNQILPALPTFICFHQLLPTFTCFCTFQHFNLSVNISVIRFCLLCPLSSAFTYFCQLSHSFALSTT